MTKRNRKRDRRGPPKGQPIQKPRGYWMEYTNVERELKVWIKKHGRFPGHKDLGSTGHSSLAAACCAYHGGLVALRERMGHGSPSRRSAGFWKEWANVERELKAWILKHKRFPTMLELKESEGSALLNGIHKHHGGFFAVRIRMGYEPLKKPHGYWKDRSNVERELKAWIEKHGSFPLKEELERDIPSLASAITKYHGGLEAFRNPMGYASSETKPDGYWKDVDRVHSELNAWIEKHGKFPRALDLRKAGHSTLVSAIYSHHGGLSKVRGAMKYGQLRRGWGYWLEYTNVERELRAWIEKHGSFPTHAELQKAKLSSLAAAIHQHHGGLPALRSRFGYGPVTPELLTEYAEPLARALLKLREVRKLESAAFWRAIKSRWTAKDLRDAVEAFKKAKSLVAFRKLLDQT